MTARVGMDPFGHVDIRVRDMEAALAFYGALLPALGFTRTFHGPLWKVFAAEGDLPSVAYFALIEDLEHLANKNRIAFWAETPADVDRLAGVALDAGARVTSGPQHYPEYGPGYYAVYFEDPSGNRLEVVHRSRE
jgi:catechol 2,3-dioxygenase-like lactoylglutathione lyase family enzyme